jgi:hypothetical protein
MHHIKKNIMRKLTVIFHAIVFLILALSCEENDNEIKDGFSLVINDSITYNSNSIDFYDFSSHLIYLKSGDSFSFSNRGTFKIQVDNKEIYTGQMFSMYSSYLPSGVYIRCAPTFYKDYIIPIGFSQIIDTEGNSIEDPRNDSRIIDALEKHNQYREGLSSEIISVQKIMDNKVKITLELSNLDTDNLLYLDPDKMGLGLFHYFTNGLIIRDSQRNSYTHKLTTQKPEPWDSWKADWLTVINGNETKTISILYNDFDLLSEGEYTASFSYPGLSHQIELEDLQQKNGRIWLGELYNIKTIDIE